MSAKSTPDGKIKKETYVVGGNKDDDSILTRLKELEKEITILKKENKEIKERLNGIILYLKSAFILVNNSTIYLSSLNLSVRQDNGLTINKLPIVFKKFLTKQQLAYLIGAANSGLVDSEFFVDIYPDIDVSSLNRKLRSKSDD